MGTIKVYNIAGTLKIPFEFSQNFNMENIENLDNVKTTTETNL